MRLLFIALGGAVGALLRYAVSGLTYRYLGSNFPWGTLSVNLIGALVIGFLWGLSEGIAMSSHFRTFAFIGVIGSFTTLSTYSLETFHLFRTGAWKGAVLNIFLTNVMSILLVILGFMVSKYGMAFMKK